MRIVAERQQVLRLDWDMEDSRIEYEKLPIENISKEMKDIDGLIISDYGKGVCLDSIIRKLINIAKKINLPVYVEPKGNVTIRKIHNELKKRELDIEFHVVSNPEFLKEGDAISDFMRPDRIVVGTEDSPSIDTFKKLYAPFNRNRDKMVFMDARSAELTKYAANIILKDFISNIE